MGTRTWRRIVGYCNRGKQGERRSEFWRETEINIKRKIKKEGESSLVK